MVYPAEAAQGDEALARVIFTDSLFGGSARWVAAETAEGAPSYLYHFSYIAEAYRPVAALSLRSLGNVAVAYVSNSSNRMCSWFEPLGSHVLSDSLRFS
jgi:carboxylesterase type B